MKDKYLKYSKVQPIMRTFLDEGNRTSIVKRISVFLDVMAAIYISTKDSQEQYIDDSEYKVFDQNMRKPTNGHDYEEGWNVAKAFVEYFNTRDWSQTLGKLEGQEKRIFDLLVGEQSEEERLFTHLDLVLYYYKRDEEGALVHYDNAKFPFHISSFDGFTSSAVPASPIVTIK